MNKSEYISAARLEEIQEVIRYRFKEPELLVRAFTHTSFANEKHIPSQDSNERLEFLGDAVIALVTNRFLYEKYEKENEGFLTRVKSLAVSKPSLSKAAAVLGLGKYLLLGKGEEASGGQQRDSSLSNVFEALTGGIYLDGGLDPASVFLRMAFLDEIVVDEREAKDYKSELQEYIQKKHKKRPHYQVVSEVGPEHQKVFFVKAVFNGEILGEGRGKSKKEAELEAARAALEALKKKPADIKEKSRTKI